jgi:squalene-hopene/tetraprenyl-beta-curcumene cyclase
MSGANASPAGRSHQEMKFLPALDRTLATLTQRLLEQRMPHGHWEGRLSSSALSTATAIVALVLADRTSPLIRAGCDWLIANQNEDGGWGDTVRSHSNLSTTLLSWSALSFAGDRNERADHWLHGHIGELNPVRLKGAILERYGKDRTFSVPILTVLAITGKLGSGTTAWRMVPQLPFELAAFPHQVFRWLRLPVVSYALPALIAIGQARHHHAASRNLPLRAVRSSLRSSTLSKLRDMQPESGGFLEAIPLTAFVCMNLLDSGAGSNPVVMKGIHFLKASARADGSWPIDTNLATWVTTHAVHELPQAEGCGALPWLLQQQVREEHPFTRAKPGGWAWTDLSGGVPDADDTACALLAIWKLAGVKHLDVAAAGVQWLVDLQNADGGIPTFCRGWGALPFDRSAPELTAHALEAWKTWRPALSPELQQKVDVASGKALSYLARQQKPDGSWIPLWFGNQHASGEENPTYGTARVLATLRASVPRERGLQWLLNAQNADGGWGGDRGVPSTIEETGIALAALPEECSEAIQRAALWLINATDEGRQTPPSPIGLYFARLWYYEELYPVLFALRGLSHAREILVSSRGAEARNPR